MKRSAWYALSLVLVMLVAPVVMAQGWNDPDPVQPNTGTSDWNDDGNTQPNTGETGWNDDDQPVVNNNNNSGTSDWNDDGNTTDHQTNTGGWNDEGGNTTNTGSSWNDVYDQGNTAYQGGSWNDAVSHYDNIYTNDGYSSWNDDKKKEFFANAGSSYLFYGIELYNGRSQTSSWNNRYKEALKYLEKAYFELLRAADSDWRKDYRGVWREWVRSGSYSTLLRTFGNYQQQVLRGRGWFNYWGGDVHMARKLALCNYYMGMCYYELRAWHNSTSYDYGYGSVDNKKLCYVMLTLFIDMWPNVKDVFSRYSDRNVYQEQYQMYGMALFTLAKLESGSSNAEVQAKAMERYTQAHNEFRRLRALGVEDFNYYLGDFRQGYSHNVMSWNDDWRKRSGGSTADRLQQIEDGLLTLAKAQIENGRKQGAKAVATYLMRNAEFKNTKEQASMVMANAASSAQESYDIHRDYRRTYGFEEHTLEMARLSRDKLGKSSQALTHYQEVLNQSSQSKYKKAAETGIVSIIAPPIKAKVESNPLQAAKDAVAAINQYKLTSDGKTEMINIGASAVDKLVSQGNHSQAEAAMKVLEPMASNSLKMSFDNKRIAMIQQRFKAAEGDQRATVLQELSEAVKSFESRWSSKSAIVANYKILLAALEDVNDTAGITRIEDKLASLGDQTGLQAHDRRAQNMRAEIDKMDAANKRVELLKFGLLKGNKPASMSHASDAIFEKALQDYLAQYSSPWYRDAKGLVDKTWAGSDRRKVEKLSKEKYNELANDIMRRETGYAGYGAKQLDDIFAPNSEAVKSWAALKKAYEEFFQTFHNYDKPWFPGDELKKAWADAPAKLERARSDFFGKAYPGPSSSVNRSTTTMGDEDPVGFGDLNNQ